MLAIRNTNTSYMGLPETVLVNTWRKTKMWMTAMATRGLAMVILDMDTIASLCAAVRAVTY